MNSKKCKIKREELGLTQDILAGKIGYSPSAISLYERKEFGGRKLVESLEEFFSNPNQEEQSKKERVHFHHPTKEESSKFQIRDEVIRLDDGMSVGTLTKIISNYLLTAKDSVSTPQLYHPAYFKAKKST